MAKINEKMTAELAKEELDAQAIDRLAAAWAKLGELERTFDGRPAPGTLRPRPERRQSAPPLPGPLG
jgi:hypothetical protein